MVAHTNLIVLTKMSLGLIFNSLIGCLFSHILNRDATIIDFVGTIIV